MDNKGAVWQVESEYLGRVVRVIREQIAIAESKTQDRLTGVTQERQWMFENATHRVGLDDDWAELMFHIRDTHRREQEYDLVYKKADRLRLMAATPFFGRFDFREHRYREGEAFYVGLYSLNDPDGGSFLVCDWRAPVCSMYYDYEPGPAAYHCQAGAISGELTLKRQFVIKNGLMEGMFDSNLHIADRFLQDVLAQNAGQKMRAIVASIQREQNAAIREDRHDILVVQGAAGSGKTSVALQRAAYLLYHHRAELKAHQIVAFLPTYLLTEYTSGVLPELGEENIRQTTFYDYVCRRMALPVDAVETLFDQQEGMMAECDHQVDHDVSGHVSDYVLRGRAARTSRQVSVHYKSGRQFETLLTNYVDYLHCSWQPWADVYFRGEKIISVRQISRLVHEDFACLPLLVRLEKARTRIMILISPIIRKTAAEIRELRRQEAMGAEILSEELRQQLSRDLKQLRADLGVWAAYDVLSLYAELFVNEELFDRLLPAAGEGEGVGREEWEEVRRLTAENISNGKVLYEDLPALLYLKSALQGVPDVRHIRHLIIDEAQNYTWMQLRALAVEFPRASLTMLGDPRQEIGVGLPQRSPIADQHKDKDRDGGLTWTAEAFAPRQSAHIELTKRYRSTWEIARFTGVLADPPETGSSIERRGILPLLVRVATEEGDSGAMGRLLTRRVLDLFGEGFGSVAVLCRKADTCREIYQLIGAGLADAGKDMGGGGQPVLGGGQPVSGDRKPVSAQLVLNDDRSIKAPLLVMPAYLASGMEFDAVIVPDVGCYRAGERRMLYTVCTRALHRLYLYTVGDAVGETRGTPGTPETPELLRTIDPEYYSVVDLV